MLDTYGKLGKPLVLSEISISSEDEEIQALAAERLYRVCFSHESMSGIFWRNLDDNSILCDKQRNALGEGLLFAALVRNREPKKSYKVLDKLINEEWHTEGKTETANGKCGFRGFYGLYDITVNFGGKTKTLTADFSKKSDNSIAFDI